MGITVSFACRLCGAPDVEVEVVIDTPSTPAYLGGLPEDCYPAESCEWHAEGAATCPECDAVHDTRWLETHIADEVVEREAEREDARDAMDCDYD